MKSFSQFLQETYLIEEDEVVQGRLLNRKNQAYKDINNPNPGNRGYATDPVEQNAKSSSPGDVESGKIKTSPGQLEIPDSTPPSSKRNPSGAATDPWHQFPRKQKNQYGIPKPPSSSVPYGNRTLPGSPGSSSTPLLPPGRSGGPLAKPISAFPTELGKGAYDAAVRSQSGSTKSSTPKSPSGSRPAGLARSGGSSRPALPPGQLGKTTAKEAEKAFARTAGKGLLKGLGKVAGPASALLDVADEKSSGSGWLRSLAKGATVAAGGALGGVGGSAVGPAGSFAGAIGGSIAASKAFDVAAGANASQRKAMATANRKSQSGGALKGGGGKTTFDTTKNTITSGGKTANLGKTSVVTDPKTGKKDVGYLAYQGGKAVYKRAADPSTLAQTSSNPLERIGRTLFAGAYKQKDAEAASRNLAKAQQSDAARNKALGLKTKPAG
jgi:hypothetical protein